MGSTLAPDFVEDAWSEHAADALAYQSGGVSRIDVNEDILWNRAANHPDTIANARGFLEETYNK